MITQKHKVYLDHDEAIKAIVGHLAFNGLRCGGITFTEFVDLQGVKRISVTADVLSPPTTNAK